MKFKNILFDLDGTLTDPFEGLANAVIYSLEKMGMTENDRESIRRFIGPPLVHSYRELYNLSNEDAEQAVIYYREFYDVTGIYQNRVYDKMEELLKLLKQNGASLFVATSKPQPFAERILEHFNIHHYFDHIEGVSFENSEVEKDVLMNNIIEKYHLIKNETAMVGDRKFDILSANKVGITSIALMHGYGSMEEFIACNADVVVAGGAELIKLLVK